LAHNFFWYEREKQKNLVVKRENRLEEVGVSALPMSKGTNLRSQVIGWAKPERAKTSNLLSGKECKPTLTTKLQFNSPINIQ
jgi:hypothetical protein